MHLASDEFIQNPYPSYRQLRQVDGGYWLEVGEGEKAGMWLFSRYGDVAALLREATRISKQANRLAADGQKLPFDQMMLSNDPPEHRRLRDLAVPAFSPERLAFVAQQLRGRIDRLLDVVLDKGNCDFMSELALPVPVSVAATLLGVPEQDSSQLCDWTEQLLLSFDSIITNATNSQRSEHWMQLLQQYFEQQLMRPDPPAGSILDLLRKRPDVSRGEAIGLCMLIVIAGYETTVHLLGNGLRSLLENPAQLQLLREQAELLDSAIEEMLRFESPLQRSTFRVVREPIEIGGRELEPGTQVAALFGAANRDETQFVDAERFDIRRTPNKHLAFGVGVHRCLGERLARLEARLVFERLLQRTSAMELQVATPRYRRTTMFRSLEALPVAFKPR
jgi:cytochrome P450